MGEAASNLVSVNLGEAVLVFADGVDEDVADRDLARLGAAPRDYRNRDTIGEILTLTRILHPIQDQIVPDARLIALILFPLG